MRFCGLPRLQHQQCRVGLRLVGALSSHASGGAFFACRRERSAFRASRCRIVASRAASCTEPHRSWGTEGSDPAPTRESTANPDFRAHADTAIPKLFCSRLRRAGGTSAICGPGALARAVVEKGPPPKTRASTSRRADGEDRKRRWESTTGHGLPDLVCPSANAYLVPRLPRRSRRHMFSALIFPFRGVHGLRCGALPALRKTRH
jgi:hypothetical protein